MPNVQWKTSDDGQRNRPKHVGFLDKYKFGKLVRLLVLLKRNVTMHDHMNVKYYILPLPQHTLPFMYLCSVPDDRRMQRPKHFVRKQINERAGRCSNVVLVGI